MSHPVQRRWYPIVFAIAALVLMPLSVLLLSWHEVDQTIWTHLWQTQMTRLDSETLLAQKRGVRQVMTSGGNVVLTPDKPGVLAGLTQILSAHGVSVLSMYQGEPNADGQAIIEVTTHPVRGGAFLAAVTEIDRMGITAKPTVCLRKL